MKRLRRAWRAFWHEPPPASPPMDPGFYVRWIKEEGGNRVEFNMPVKEMEALEFQVENHLPKFDPENFKGYPATGPAYSGTFSGTFG